MSREVARTKNERIIATVEENGVHMRGMMSPCQACVLARFADVYMHNL